MGALEHCLEPAENRASSLSLKPRMVLSPERKVRQIHGDEAVLLFQLDSAAPAAQVYGHAPAAFLERKGGFPDDFRVVGNGFLAFAGERHPDAGHVHQDHHGPERERSRGWASPYAFQFTPETALEIAQAPPM